MRLLTTTALLLLGVVSAFGAEQRDTSETRKVAAQKYAAVANVSKMLDDTFKAMSQNMPEKERPQFLELTKKFVRPRQLESLLIASMVKHFTTKELEALAAFYGSAEGKSIMAKFGTYTADVLPLVQAEVAHAVQEMRKELEDKNTKVPRGA
jgi:hypothetical protein